MELWDLYRNRDFEIRPTLERIERAVRHVGDPQKNFPSLLVGGTNGKGSTCAFAERILRYHRYKTGWFVSPHLVRENERWRINGSPMPDERLSYYVKELRSVFERFELTYFEAATLIAMLYFSDEGVDVAIMEVGMGGRWDATKVSEPAVVGITNVERDHTRWLGRNIEEIAEDKLHLHREGAPLVLGSAKYPLYTKALEKKLRNLVVAGLDFTYRGDVVGGRTLLKDFNFSDIRIDKAVLGLLGRWQVDNAALALTMVRLLCDIDTCLLVKALEDTRWEGRMEILRKSPLLIVDGSHNPYSVAKVVKEAKRLFGDINFLFTGLRGKDWKLSLELLRRHSERVILTEVSHPRGEPVRNLYTYAKDIGFRKIGILGAPSEAWSLEEDVLALGSLYLVGDIKKAAPDVVK